MILTLLRPVYIGGLFGVEINLAIARIPFNALSDNLLDLVCLSGVYITTSARASIKPNKTLWEK